MDKKDKYIKAKLQEDKKISVEANEIFDKFEGGINLDNKKKTERKVIKLSLNQAVLAFSMLIIVGVLGGNLYAHIQGKPNIYSAIKNLFVKEDKYVASEIEINQTVESNGIKLTLKTVAMDENILITKYIAEGEKLSGEFYTYPEFEEDIMECVNMMFVIKGKNTPDDIKEKYKGYTVSENTQKLREIKLKLEKQGVAFGELYNPAYEAYEEYLGAQYGIESDAEGNKYTYEEGKKKVEQVIALFEGKVTSQYKILESNDKLQNFGINTVSQKIEKQGNQYIIYNVYNVDTITDLASNFKLDINVNKIGSIEGKWNFSTNLEKARLDTRVETIDFYEDNFAFRVAACYIPDKWASASVEAKRLVISDFSTVLMIQTKEVENEIENQYSEYGQGGLPCVFIVKDGKR